jgi:lipoate-protein ligase B
MAGELTVAVAGRVEYARALAWQEALLERRLAGPPDVLVLLEHAPVYTLGRGADDRFLGTAREADVPVLRVGRGGQVTYHGPGQLVGYPIIGLRDHRPDVHWYVRTLEEVLIRALGEVGIRAGRVDGRTGVWVDGRRKIASIGVGIRRWVTWHGFALNVGRDLSGFVPITPCGLDGVEMTSVANEGGPSEVDALLSSVREHFVAVFGYRTWSPIAADAMAEARE